MVNLKIDLNRVVTAPFADHDWVKKTFLGLLWFTLGITMPAVYGAQMEYIRQVTRGNDSLPEWDDFGKQWIDGLKFCFALFIYTLPLIILYVTMMPAIIALPMGFIALGEGSDAAAVRVPFAIITMYVLMFAYMAINAICSLALGVFFRAAMVNYAMTQRFGAFFEFRKIMRLMRGKTGYWSVWFFGLVIGYASCMVTYFLGATFVGAILIGGVVYLAAMMDGNALGQWAAVAFGNDSAHGAEPPAPPIMPAPPVLPAPPAPPVPPPPAPAGPLIGAEDIDDQPR
ncbi:MAG: DUF4013 domain-containing protein [Coriobacteriia bacterium]|nr:DUF4013 domain-containing protein [Coriobacteriia bacterium]